MSVPSEVIKVPACTIVNRLLSQIPQACFCVLSNKLTLLQQQMAREGRTALGGENTRRLPLIRSQPPIHSRAGRCHGAITFISYILHSTGAITTFIPAVNNRHRIPELEPYLAGKQRWPFTAKNQRDLRFVSDSRELRRSLFCPTFPTWLISSRRARLAPLAKARSKRKGGQPNRGVRRAQAGGAPADFWLFLVQTSTRQSSGACDTPSLGKFPPFSRRFRPRFAHPEKLGSHDSRVLMTFAVHAARRSALLTSAWHLYPDVMAIRLL